MKRTLAVLFMASLLGCDTRSQAPTPPQPLPVAQWRFIDIDTRQPIAGVWVNFAWNGKPTERGMSTCVRGVLAQSDKDGWVRDTAREAHWRVAPGSHIFKPGYERMAYTMGVGNEANSTFITSKIYQDRNYFGHYPAWEEKLKALGYVWADHYWTKRFPRGDIPDALREPERPERYLMTYRSIPYEVEQSFVFLGHECVDSGAENIGLSRERKKQSDRERALDSTRYLCLPDWDTLQKDSGVVTEFIHRALWLMPNRSDVWEVLKIEQPKVYQYATTSHYFNPQFYTRQMRLEFCAWLEQRTGEELYDN